jgi:hypothetical protein
MKQYKLLLNGGVTPQLTLEFSMASDAMAMDYCQRVIPQLTSKNYWDFNLFCVDEVAPHAVASYSTKETVVITRRS